MPTNGIKINNKGKNFLVTKAGIKNQNQGSEVDKTRGRPQKI
jgi:hypothetical protein